ncbi:MAG: amidohydrolase [Isosphaera sp.]|nr:amidohydrolase [Isosphaera sp.]
MGESLPTRRGVLAAAGAALAGGLARAAGVETAPAPRPKPGPPLVDSHFHLVDPRLPGTPDIAAPDEGVPLAPFPEGGERDGARRLARAIEATAAESGMVAALCMPRTEVSDRDPLGIKEIEAVAPLVRGVKLHPVGFANPERFDRDHLARVEAVLRQGRVKALKVYLGYLHYGPDHPGYRPYYALAAKYLVPVVFHTGDPYSRKAKVKFARPLPVDDVAVDFPDTRFVLAHFGNPWLADAAEVVYKNPNVWADLSGFLVGDREAFARYGKAGVLGRAADRVRAAIEFTGAPDRFLFGSDWPLAPVAVYRDFVRTLFPEEEHPAVFRDNARTLFGV